MSRPRRRRTVFRADEELQLAEIDIPPRVYFDFGTGHTLATLHWRGVVHGDLHNAHCLFEASSGVTGFIDLSPFDDRTDIDPERMVRDIVIASLNLGRLRTIALLGGYVRSCSLLIEPEYPGYVDAVLALLGGQVRSQSRPAAPVLTADRCAELLDPILDTSGGGLAIRPGASAPAGAGHALCGLLLAGVDPLSLPDAALSDLPAPVAELVRTASPDRQAARPADDRLIRPAYDLLRTLGARMTPGPDVSRLLMAMIDVCDWLAERLLREYPRSADAFVNSVRLAQLSLIILQNPMWTVQERELAELAVTARHRYLFWYQPMLLADPADEPYPQLFTYLNSRITVYESLFNAPDAPGNRLWSANWRAMAMSRFALLQLLRAVQAKAGPTAHEEFLRDAIRFAAAKVGRAARDNLNASMQVHGPTILMPEISPVGDEYQYLFNELGRASDIIKELDAGIDLAAFGQSELVKQAVELLDRKQRLNFDVFVAGAVDPSA